MCVAENSDKMCRGLNVNLGKCWILYRMYWCVCMMIVCVRISLHRPSGASNDCIGNSNSGTNGIGGVGSTSNHHKKALRSGKMRSNKTSERESQRKRNDHMRSMWMAISFIRQPFWETILKLYGCCCFGSCQKGYRIDLDATLFSGSDQTRRSNCNVPSVCMTENRLL